MPHSLLPKSSLSLSLSYNNQSCQGISYNDVKPGKAPLAIVSAPRPSSAQANLHPSLRNPLSPRSSCDDISTHKRDSGYTSSINFRPIDIDSTNGFVADQSIRSSQSFRKSLRKSQSLPRIASPELVPLTTTKRLHKLSEQNLSMESPITNEAPKLPELTLPSYESPTLSFDELTTPGNMEFSKRGSLYIGGQKPDALMPATPPRRVVSSILSQGPPRILSTDEATLSQRVRSLYEQGSNQESSSVLHRISYISQEPVIQEELNTTLQPHSPSQITSKSASKRDSFVREEQELAGGIEDWQDIQNEDVDRYGFIIPKYTTTSHDSLPVPQPGIHRVATSLQLAAETPRRRYSRIGKDQAATRSMRSLRDTKETQGSPGRPISAQSAYSTTKNISMVRTATNKLPHNKDRRLKDEASNMLTLPPEIATPENTIDPKAALIAKKREWSREEKWRKMAKITRPNGMGGPTDFEFDPKDPKVISRAWKGIPDRWRATAWHSFLTASAKRHPNFQTDAELIASFVELVDQGSPDDVQIDLDVPRTISSHIMFRRRYRGGQRLLFRVLHALSLYFPETGYVQGMAALAATFLCYFEEGMAFVMLVRLWQTRGLDRLYQNGFEGLMTALGEFENGWLANGTINSKLTELGITPTAYGTRWYLTIFNYTIPFSAQLRVWDVFLLLGDPDNLSSLLQHKPSVSKPDEGYHGGLDVLHATSAALIDGIRDILLESDFENAMKALTSWIPVRDEDLLMRVTRAEWKTHRRRK